MNEQAWARARRARDQLAARLLSHPNVSMVDLGQQEGAEGPALQVHVRSESGPLPEIPVELDGIPVHMVHGDYQPESAD